MQHKPKTPNPNTLVFDKHTAEYDSWYDTYVEVFQSEVAAIRDMLPPGNSRGIEVGIGTGRFAKALGIHEGVEPSGPMRDMAIDRGLEVMDGIAELLPYRDLQFDFVLMSTCISFLQDVHASFRQAHRVLKHHGMIIVGFIEKNSLIGKYYENKRPLSTFYKTANFYSAERVLEELRKAGFGSFETSQTLFGELNEIDSFQPAEPGYGKGSFVVIKAAKK